MANIDPNNRFVQRLNAGETIVCGEGYLFEIERRGYLCLGHFVPTVVVDNPEAVKQLHREMINCGSDIILAFTYYAHKERLAKVGKEHLVDEINKKALEIAKEVMAEPGNENVLLAGNICNTNLYQNNEESKKVVLEMFREQCRSAKEAGAELIIAETIGWLGEAELALQAINEVNLPSVINLSFHQKDTTKTTDGFSIEETYTRLRNQGATVVGSNCHLGPNDILKVGEVIRKTIEGPISLLPVTYRTNNCGFFHLENQDETKLETSKAFPDSMEYYMSTRGEIAKFGYECKQLGIQFVGLCCGSSPYLLRALCNGVGKSCRADKFNVDMSKHFKFGDKALDVNKEKYYKG